MSCIRAPSARHKVHLSGYRPGRRDITISSRPNHRLHRTSLEVLKTTGILRAKIYAERPRSNLIPLKIAAINYKMLIAALERNASRNELTCHVNFLFIIPLTLIPTLITEFTFILIMTVMCVPSNYKRKRIGKRALFNIRIARVMESIDANVGHNGTTLAFTSLTTSN